MRNEKNYLLQESNKHKKEIEELKNINKLLNEELKKRKEENDDIKENEKENEKKKIKLINTDIQIKIALNELSKAKSMLLCIQPQWIKKDGNKKDFSFLKFLQTNLSDKVVNQLFSKFNKKNENNSSSIDSIDENQLISCLALTVIIYKVKLYQLKTGDSKKPKIESNKIKQIVQHIAVYIVRTYGQRKKEKEEISFIDQDGNKINGKYYGYTFTATKDDFRANIANYIKQYIDNQGEIKIE